MLSSIASSFTFSVYSTPGVRPVNEDLVVADPSRGLLVVADGCGGPGKGDRASSIVRDCIRSEPDVSKALAKANMAIYSAIQANPALKGMGATIALAQIQGQRVNLYHAGEVRGCLVRGGTVKQLTEDHTLASQLVKTKQITPEAATTHPGRKAILRYLGKAENVALEHHEIELEPADALILCSDGLYSAIPPEALSTLMVGNPDQATLDERLAQIVRQAQASGSDDNISIAVLRAPSSFNSAPHPASDGFYQRFIERASANWDLQEALRYVLEEMAAQARAENAFISLFDGEGQVARSIVLKREGDPKFLFPHSHFVVQQIQGKKESLWITDAKTDPRLAGRKSAVAAELGMIVALPLVLGSGLAGVIYLESAVPRSFSAQEVKGLEGLGICARFAIDNTQSRDNLADRIKKSEIINDVSLAINATINLEQLLTLILHHSLGLSGGDQGYILLGSGEDLECFASLNKEEQPIQDLQISRSIIQRCLNENHSICILDTQSGEEYQTKSVMAFDLRSVMCIPLITNKDRLGVLYLSSNAITKTFSSHDQSLLESIATQAALTIRNAQLLREQERQIIELERALELFRQAENAASTDMLTGLHNRRYFEEHSPGHIALCKRHNRALSLILLDVDHFKQFNDTYGHAIGDEVLKAMGQVFSHFMRISDISARLGGEEFVVLCPDTDLAGALILAERIRRSISEVQLQDSEGKPVRQITVSLGIASWQVGDGNITEALERADIALYACKAHGRNQVQIWTPEMVSQEKKQEQESGH